MGKHLKPDTRTAHIVLTFGRPRGRNIYIGADLGALSVCCAAPKCTELPSYVDVRCATLGIVLLL